MTERFDSVTRRLRDDIGVLRRAEGRDDAKDSEDETKVADAIRDESLARSIRRLGAVEVITDQQIRTEPDTFPTDKHHHEVRAHHQHEHRKHEQTHVGEEPVEARVAMHVTGGEDEDAQAHAGDDQHEDRRERIELVAPFNVEQRAAHVAHCDWLIGD